MAHIEIRNLNFRYPLSDRNSLENINLDIEKGSYTVLCGQSGSGKTTLLKHLKSQLTPYGEKSGSIIISGKNISEINSMEQASKIGFVMQNPDDQIVTDKVWHELAFGLENIGCSDEIMQLRVAEMASYFGIQSWFERDVGTLSGGEKQLLNLASIMVMQPEILILDEPTAQLDPIAASDFLNTVRKINAELGTTVIITEHRLEDIYTSADKVIVMENGRITAQGEPKAVGQQIWEQQSPMFAALPAPMKIFYQSGETGNPPLTVREGRKWLTDTVKNSHITFSEPERKEKVINSKIAALSIRDGWFRYDAKGNDILQGINLSVPEGSFYAIVGGNGTGKSTTLKACCGICKLYRGKVEIFGKNIRKYNKGELFDNCISMLPQNPVSLFSGRTVEEDLAEMTKNREEIQSISELCEISHLLKSHPHDLSGGEQQRVALAKVLLTNPLILLMDEPTKGLDSFFKQKFAGIIKKLRSRGVTVVMVSHDIEFCAEYAELVSMFFNGKIVTTGTPQKFFGANSFYTTASNRMSRCVFNNAVTVDDVAELYRRNKGEIL